MGEVVGHADRAEAEIARARCGASRGHDGPVTEQALSGGCRWPGVLGSGPATAGKLDSDRNRVFNAAGELGVGQGGYASLEAIVNAKPIFFWFGGGDAPG